MINLGNSKVSNKVKTTFILIIFVLCLLGLSAVHETYHSSVVARGVTLEFAVAPSSVSVWDNSLSAPIALSGQGSQFSFVAGVGDSFTVSYTYNYGSMSGQLVDTNSGQTEYIYDVSPAQITLE